VAVTTANTAGVYQLSCGVFFVAASSSQHAWDDVPALSDSGEAFLTAVGFEEQVIRVYPKSL
jgi:hypothetical protein